MKPSDAPTLLLRPDGYVGLCLATLQELPLAHLASALDEHDTASTSVGATVTIISGYTEWVSNTVPAVSIGWDWTLRAAGPPGLVRTGEIRSNVMLIDLLGNDLGADKTRMLVETVVADLPWVDTVLGAIGSCHT